MNEFRKKPTYGVKGPYNGYFNVKLNIDHINFCVLSMCKKVKITSPTPVLVQFQSLVNTNVAQWLTDV